MEKVDIVNKNNQVVGVKTKAYAHQKGLLHRCVIAELKDTRGNWIFVKQSSKRQDKGQLASAAGGHIKSGETEINALSREVYEELGITNYTQKLKDKIIFNRSVNNHFENHYFIVFEIVSDEIPNLNEESEEYQRFTPQKLARELKNHPEKFGNALKYILKNLYPEIYSDA